MALRFADMRGIVEAAGPTLIHFAAGTYIDREFSTFPGEVTNAEVRQIAAYMGPQRKFGIFGMDQNHGPILVATSPDENEDNFELVDPKLYGAEIGITDWAKQPDRLRGLTFAKPVQIIPDEHRYETWFQKWGRTDAAHFAKDEMAATVISWWEAKALAMFMAGAKGLSGTSDLLSSAQFDALVHGLKYMTSTGELTDISGSPLRSYSLPQIVSVNDPRFPSLANGIRPNTTCNWTRTEWDHRDRSPFSHDLKNFLSVQRGGSWADYYLEYLCAAYRDAGAPEDRLNVLGFRVAVASSQDNNLRSLRELAWR